MNLQLGVNKNYDHCYVCPEMLIGQKMTPKSDMWNLGLMIYEFSAGKKLLKIPKSE